MATQVNGEPHDWEVKQREPAPQECIEKGCTEHPRTSVLANLQEQLFISGPQSAEMEAHLNSPEAIDSMKRMEALTRKEAQEPLFIAPDEA